MSLIYQCIYEWCTLVYLGSLNDYLLFLRSFYSDSFAFRSEVKSLFYQLEFRRNKYLSL